MKSKIETLYEVSMDDFKNFFEEKMVDACTNGMYYNDLPEELRDTLDSYSLTIYYFENITDDQIAEMFFRLNNGY